MKCRSVAAGLSALFNVLAHWDTMKVDHNTGNGIGCVKDPEAWMNFSAVHQFDSCTRAVHEVCQCPMTGGKQGEVAI